MRKTEQPVLTRSQYNQKTHSIGRIFTWIALGLIMLVPVIYCLEAKVLPDGKAVVKSLPFLLGYLVVGLIESISYAPLLGTAGQYMSFITGNISNLKLPCAINSRSLSKAAPGSEEQELITTISIAVSTIVTTVIIVIGLIPLYFFRAQIVSVLSPISPYVIPAIFGGLTLVLVAQYFKIAFIPFIVCIAICVVGNLLGFGSSLGQSTMVLVGMAVSGISTTILYKKNKI